MRDDCSVRLFPLIFVIVTSVTILLTSSAKDADKLRTFNDTYEAMSYYGRAESCAGGGILQVKAKKFNQAANQSRDKILKAVRAQYGENDYQTLKKFFEIYLIEWNKKERDDLYPCYAAKVKIKENVSWIVVFRWEIHGLPGSGEYVTLGHEMLFQIAPTTGAIIDTASCG